MYTIKRRAVRDLGTPAVTSLTSVADSALKYVVQSQMDVDKLLAVVSTAVVSSGAVAVSYYRCPTMDSGGAGARILLGVVLIPAGTAVGKVVYKDISPTLVVPGDQIVMAVTTAAAGGGAAGAAFLDVQLSDSPEQSANSANMIASA